MPRPRSKARDQARAANRLLYAGATCREGHDGRRYVSTGACATCANGGTAPRRVLSRGVALLLVT